MSSWGLRISVSWTICVSPTWSITRWRPANRRAGGDARVPSDAGPSSDDTYWDQLVVVAEGDHVVQFGRRGGDWAGGDFMGFPAEPGSYLRGFAAMYRFEDGKIAERWAIRDDLEMLKHLSAFDAHPR